MGTGTGTADTGTVTAPRRLLALCADDFGQSAAINAGIVQLVAQGRLTAVSCLVNGPAWADGASELTAVAAVQAAAGAARVGLHFNLTEGRPLSAALARHWPALPALPRLLALAHLRRLPLAALGHELQAQLQAFQQATGRAPQHIDGHQHVHHLPQVRQLVLDQLATLPPGTLVRHTGCVRGPGFAVKRWLIAHTGGRQLGRQLVRLGVHANTQLLGVYDFAASANPATANPTIANLSTADHAYRRLMQHWLAALPAQGGLVFCHPGQAGDDASDPIAAARVCELAYLRSDAFAADLAAAGVALGDARPSVPQPTPAPTAAGVASAPGGGG